MALRVVILGLGVRGMDWARVIGASPAATLVGAADPDRTARERAAADPTCRGVPIAEELDDLQATAPDAVIVAAPARYHAPLAEHAIAKGLAVLVEKPFTFELEAAVRVVRLAAEGAVPILVAQNYRYMRAHRTVRRLLQENAVGLLSDAMCCYWRPSHVATADLMQLEAAALWETGVHHLDAMRYALGRKVVGVSADISTAPGSSGLRGTSARVLLEFEDGIRGAYSVSWHSPGHELFEAGQQFYARFTGDAGTLHVIQRWLVLCRTGQWPRLVRRGRRDEPEEAVLLRQLAAAHTGRHESECSGRDNLQTVAILAACEQAWRTRRWVNPQELLRDAGA